MRAALCILVGLVLPFAVNAADQKSVPPSPPAASGELQILIGYLGVEGEPRETMSPLDKPITEEGLMGARVGLADDNTTGRLMKQNYKMDEVLVPDGGDVKKAARDLIASGHRYIVADLPAAQLLAVADLPEAKDAMIFNVQAKDDLLRGADCRANVFHATPNRAMLADALAQYLIKMRWSKWFLVSGKTDQDKLYAQAIRRSAKRFNAKIVSEKEWTFAPESKHTDDGHVSEQETVPVFTQGPDYDVLIVADEADNFGDFLPYHTFTPRLVAGTHGLVPTAWNRTNEAWGATQFHNRFERKANRWMTERDYAAWVAVRTVGEAATRLNSGDLNKVRAFVLSPDFAISSFMGTGASYRPWDHQLRQQILLTGPRMLVSFSPQPGFLHEFDTLDTLGFDKPDSACKQISH